MPFGVVSLRPGDVGPLAEDEDAGGASVPLDGVEGAAAGRVHQTREGNFFPHEASEVVGRNAGYKEKHVIRCNYI